MRSFISLLVAVAALGQTSAYCYGKSKNECCASKCAWVNNGHGKMICLQEGQGKGGNRCPAPSPPPAQRSLSPAKRPPSPPKTPTSLSPKAPADFPGLCLGPKGSTCSSADTQEKCRKRRKDKCTWFLLQCSGPGKCADNLREATCKNPCEWNPIQVPKDFKPLEPIQPRSSDWLQGGFTDGKGGPDIKVWSTQIVGKDTKKYPARYEIKSDTSATVFFADKTTSTATRVDGGRSIKLTGATSSTWYRVANFAETAPKLGDIFVKNKVAKPTEHSDKTNVIKPTKDSGKPTNGSGKVCCRNTKMGSEAISKQGVCRKTCINAYKPCPECTTGCDEC